MEEAHNSSTRNEEIPGQSSGAEDAGHPYPPAHLQHVGVVKWFDPRAGFGFVRSAAGEDVFVHHTVIDMDGFRTLRTGMPVRFVASQGPKGWHAAWVRATEDGRPCNSDVDSTQRRTA